MENKYIVIVNVNGVDYMTSILAKSALEAEHDFLDEAHCGRHEYGVSACMAYDAKMMKTDAFIGAALNAQTVSPADLLDIIEDNNKRIRLRDQAEETIEKNEKAIRELQAQIEAARKVLAA